MSEPRVNASSKLSVQWARRMGVLAMVGVLVAGSFASFDAEARRMGGSRSIGKQSSVASQRSATPPPAQPTPAQQPGQAQRAQPAAPTPAPAAAAPARNRWLGPIAGLAAGLGIAALLSHFGLGEAFAGAMANAIVIALIAFAAIWLIRKFMNRRRGMQPAFQAGGALPSSGGLNGMRNLSQGGYPQEPSYTAPATSPSLAPQAASPNAPQAAPAFSIPAGFDTEVFLRNAKVYFVRLQAAWDVGNMNDIREFTTPEMFAEIRVDLASRGSEENQTDIVQLNADLLDVAEQANEYLASVRFSGLIRETQGAAAAPFVEIWNLSKSRTGGEGWLLAGIQQIEHH
ncbi:Tim44-like domain-containing protein [Paraburkholderia sp. J12]|uniref:Tim44 domain-containing protein n=1 Tax=Paraburkholderia sp. J12 TaxID=2805432 RepID=UPI002ABD50B2|nr:Tim44-like domain-containing protein [Paraburkholderia sp. J12]